ncbi:MAG: hypothetical protein ACD_3C00154G0005 [uncultured bacterium (gcode 4)]|uniref:Uncharacterized protein n=1 Tax=uncultured bacterium (gcode 4) TaxID=1234023 RepID=K2G0S2_9BACT|nr:MAG: hypothetical protein ACD_3C00154G0005 [uncultured bacterium (gcode 4)]
MIIFLFFSTIVLSIYLAVFLWLVFYFFRELKQTLSWYGIPFVPTSDHKLERFLDSVKLNSGQAFLDIGCWDGKILHAIEIRFPWVRTVWFEKSSHPYGLAIKRKEKYWCKYEVSKTDFFKSDIHDIDVIYSYMLSYLMEKIWKKIKSECRSWTILYSNSFPIPGVPIYETLIFDKDQSIYVYVVE